MFLQLKIIETKNNNWNRIPFENRIRLSWEDAVCFFSPWQPDFFLDQAHGRLDSSPLNIPGHVLEKTYVYTINIYTQ